MYILLVNLIYLLNPNIKHERKKWRFNHLKKPNKNINNNNRFELDCFYNDCSNILGDRHGIKLNEYKYNNKFFQIKTVN